MIISGVSTVLASRLWNHVIPYGISIYPPPPHCFLLENITKNILSGQAELPKISVDQNTLLCPLNGFLEFQMTLYNRFIVCRYKEWALMSLFEVVNFESGSIIGLVWYKIHRGEESEKDFP
ncbi:MAG: hypothetical protein LBK64_07985 [Spirochaetaceae bacterium]|jgi:hypothetical protein|nr:hypothetical protein [Spirochaetaceae bacterium]